MNLKFVITFFLLTGINLKIQAQIENKNNSIKFEVIEDDFKKPAGLELPAIKLPSIIKPQNPFNENYKFLIKWAQKNKSNQT